MACSVNCLWCLKCFGVDNSQRGSRNLIVKSDGKTANFLLLFGVWVYANGPMCLPRTLLLDASGLHIYCDVEAMLLDLVSLSCPRTSWSVLAQNQNLSKSVPQFFSKSDGAYLQLLTVHLCRSRVRPEPLVLVDIVLTFFQSPNKSGNTFGNPSKPVLELGRWCGRMWQADVSSLFEYVWIDHCKCSWGVAGWWGFATGLLRFMPGICDMTTQVRDFTMELRATNPFQKCLPSGKPT